MPNQELTAQQIATNAELEASLTQSERNMLSPPPGLVALFSSTTVRWSDAKPVQASVTARFSDAKPLQASVEALSSDAKMVQASVEVPFSDAKKI